MLALGSLARAAAPALGAAIASAQGALLGTSCRAWQSPAAAAAAAAVGRQALHQAAAADAPADVLIVGAGHNGLVAATLLARQGLRVEVLEEKDIVGGACRTEYPFAKAPGLPQSTGASAGC